MLGEKSFNFSSVEWIGIHRRLFEGVLKEAGKIRDYNISKREWVLKGESVVYSSYTNIRETMEYDFNTEKQFSYNGLSMEEIIGHLSKFTCDIWQIHPFCGTDVIIGTRLEKPSKVNGFALLSPIFLSHVKWREDDAVHVNTYYTESWMGFCG